MDLDAASIKWPFGTWHQDTAAECVHAVSGQATHTCYILGFTWTRDAHGAIHWLSLHFRMEALEACPASMHKERVSIDENWNSLFTYKARCLQNSTRLYNNELCNHICLFLTFQMHMQILLCEPTVPSQLAPYPIPQAKSSLQSRRMSGCPWDHLDKHNGDMKSWAPTVFEHSLHP